MLTGFNETPRPGNEFRSQTFQSLECGATKLPVHKMAETGHGKRTLQTTAQNKILFQFLYSL